MTKANSLIRYNQWMKTAEDESFNTSVRSKAKDNAELVLKKYPDILGKPVAPQSKSKK